jgi:hypothetical protein
MIPLRGHADRAAEVRALATVAVTNSAGWAKFGAATEPLQIAPARKSRPEDHDAQGIESARFPLYYWPFVHRALSKFQPPPSAR